ncbi:MAG: hypothetical protein GSR86_00740 [Desulfurococcales archaeon]|nr:hypothetical protein [Desulfurococcales archaeon]
MAVEDLSQVLNSFKELGIVPQADLGYYLLLAGFTLFIILAGFATLYLAARAFRSLWNLTPGGFVKALLAITGVFIFAGLLLP